MKTALHVLRTWAAIDALHYCENLHPLEVVSRYHDPQLQVAENYSYLFNLRPNISNHDV